MKKIFLSLGVIGLLVLPIIGLAASPADIPVLTGDAMITLIKDIVNWVFWFLLVTAVIFIVMAGFMFVTAQGDPAKVNTARNFVLYALIGVAVGALSKGLLALVSYITGTTW
jgi:hypothetical protein